MRLDVNVHHHQVDKLRTADRMVLEAIRQMRNEFMALSAKLQAAIDDVNHRLQQTSTELDAIATALANQASVTAAAVAAALARAGVDEDAAADLVTSAFNSVQEHVDAVFVTVGVTPPATTGTVTEPAPVENLPPVDEEPPVLGDPIPEEAPPVVDEPEQGEDPAPVEDPAPEVAPPVEGEDTTTG